MRPPNLQGTTAYADIQPLGNVAQTRAASLAGIAAAAATSPNTGRYFAIFKGGDQAASRAAQLLEGRAGLKVASTSEFKGTVTEEELHGADALVYDDLGLALIDGDSRQLAMLAEASDGLLVQPEKIVSMPNYLPGKAPARRAKPAAATWGIKASRAGASAYTGQGVKVAVLDTGFDSAHPDFAGRPVQTKSFVPGETMTDVVGHGTHCIGTACGQQDAAGMRYGVAPAAEIFAGKVLNNTGVGAQAWILSGINWAIRRGCRVISLSLVSPVGLGSEFDPAYELAGRFALSRNCVIVAAAGNESNRTAFIAPVGSPANCPSVLAVGAVDSGLAVAPFSCGSVNPGQLVDIAGPGVNIYSAWPSPRQHQAISGTSMATPHVAGIVALLWEKYPTFTAPQIMQELRRLAKGPLLPITDFGAGFVQAP